jgi:Fis family transcriptional regulator
MGSGYNTAPQPHSKTANPPARHWRHERGTEQQKNHGLILPQAGGNTSHAGLSTNMSKESIQEVVQKSLEDYFNDLGEQQPSNIYDMVVLTVEKPILEVVMTRAEGNQSHAAQMLGINRNTLRKKLQEHGLL